MGEKSVLTTGEPRLDRTAKLTERSASELDALVLGKQYRHRN